MWHGLPEPGTGIVVRQPPEEAPGSVKVKNNNVILLLIYSHGSLYAFH